MQPIDQYHQLNSSYSNPFIFRLTRRGFFSEVNGLLNAVIFGLAKRRRLIVDQTDFEGLDWNDLFVSSLPSAPPTISSGVQKEWIVDGRGDAFKRIRKFVQRRNQFRIPLWIPDLELFGQVLQVKRTIAAIMTAPRLIATLPNSLGTPYAAFHIRRGDKTIGYGAHNGLIKEGEVTEPAMYLSVLQRYAPKISAVFVMTDDYRTIEELREIAPQMHIETFCTPRMLGYQQQEFSEKSATEKTRSLIQLITEVQIASKSSIFIGGFKSNVARFVPLWHRVPEMCLSVDGWRNWTPE